MSVQFFEWPSIEQFHNVVKHVDQIKDLKDKGSKEDYGPIVQAFDKEIIYKGKVKLHGQNGAINITQDGIEIQSRSQFLDIKGSPFGKIFNPNISYFKECFSKSKAKSMIIFGEFCGPKVQKGVALSKLKGDVFAVFSILLDGELIIETDTINQLLPKLPKNFYVIDWYTKEYPFNFLEKEKMQKSLDEINDIVAKIDQECPWTLKEFDIKGPGEGLVFYPVSLKEKNGTLSLDNFSTFVFKAKGDQHRNVENQKSVQVKPQKAEDIEKFAKMMTPTPRLEQGLKEIGLDAKNTGKFVAWVKADVEKEGKDELNESGLNLKDAIAAVGKIASSWYQEQLKSKK